LPLPEEAYILAIVDNTFLYKKIAESVKRQILAGTLKPGDRLPSVREMATQWQCTAGTVQHAYQELTKQGLIISRSGRGTQVADSTQPMISSEIPLRKAALVHRAETYLLEMLNAGFALQEIEDAMRQAMDRWRTESKEPIVKDVNTIRFAGSHDLVVAWIASHYADIAPGFRMSLEFSGSLGGLIAMAEGKCDLAGCHLWDAESQQFNTPFIRRILPGRRFALVTLAQRRLGLILPPGNPAKVNAISDLSNPEIQFINRQQGSGTRVWLDHALNQLNIHTRNISGYSDDVTTHSAVARRIAEGKANAGVGLEAAASSYGLDFVFLRNDRYDLVIPQENIQLQPIKSLIDWLGTEAAKTVITNLGGYDTEGTGDLNWVE
jgi:molybdate-binding protein/DNA-binding transcriptional regulator YhcF (GntR family)